jgi:tRNA(His) guanylyltransferase
MKTTITVENKGPSLTDRMRAYEECYTSTLTKRTPIIVRLDGKAFRTWTKQLKDRPFDYRLSEIMQETTRYLMENVQGCVFSFSQSDEISLFLRDYDTLNTESWFGSSLQKIVSVAASLATAKFNQVAAKHNLSLATFDARAFILPKEEVVNYFIYRQHDGIRNSIQMLGQHVLGHKECQGKNNNLIKDMLKDHGNDWEDLKSVYKYGFAMRKDDLLPSTELSPFKDDRSYIEELVYIKSE